jgi:serine/threonine protein kinase
MEVYGVVRLPDGQRTRNVSSSDILTPTMTLIPGTQLGPYEIVSQLGSGGMGEVFRARDTKLEATN